MIVTRPSGHQIDRLVELAAEAAAWLEHRQAMFDYEAEHGHFENSDDGYHSDDEGCEIAQGFLAIMSFDPIAESERREAEYWRKLNPNTGKETQ